MSEKISEIIQKIENLTVIELNELIKQIEERFGVSSIPVFGGGISSGVNQPTLEDQSQEQSKVDVILVDSGANKIQVIKVLREINPQLGLKEAKDFVDNTPQTIKEGLDLSEANKIKEKIESAGGKVEFK
ncbi:MAG: 50S ribosomal protein L7/L12 [Candidatus Parcubacteria bacterium]|nr:MAG: 50S ribosomal protein L7/L12 [Candidatus Parcubacteria bacterium]